jgi:hypothetical protein
MKSYKLIIGTFVIVTGFFGALFLTDTQTSYAGDTATYDKLKQDWNVQKPEVSENMHYLGMLHDASFLNYSSYQSDLHESYEKKSEGVQDEMKKTPIQTVAYKAPVKATYYKKPVAQPKVVYVEKKTPSVVNNYEKSEKHETKNEVHVIHYNIVMADHTMKDDPLDEERDDNAVKHNTSRHESTYEKHEYDEDEDCPEEEEDQDESSDDHSQWEERTDSHEYGHKELAHAKEWED